MNHESVSKVSIELLGQLKGRHFEGIIYELKGQKLKVKVKSESESKSERHYPTADINEIVF